MMRILALVLTLAACLIADEAHQRQVVRLGSLAQLAKPKNGKYKAPKPHTAQRVAKPPKRARQTKLAQPVWGTPDKKRARQKR